MSMFGKVLAVLNVFGMLGLVALALMVYTKRTEWQYANYRHQLAIDGLPVFKEETDENGYVKYENLGKQTQSELFSTEPVGTQKEEVERVQKKVKAKIDAEADKSKQSALLAAYLLPLARTNAQRERLVSIRRHLADAKTVDQLKTDLLAAYKDAVVVHKADPKKQLDWAFSDRLTIIGGEPRGPFEQKFIAILQKDDTKKPEDAFAETLTALNADLQAELDRQFKQAITGNYLFLDDKGGETEKKMTLDERKDVISYLLFSMLDAETPEPAAGAQDKAADGNKQRYLKVVGLAQANRTINEQVQTLNQILSDLNYAVERDRASFAATLLPIFDQSREAARNVQKLTVDLALIKKKVNEQDVLVKAHEKDVADAKDQLAGLQKITGDKLTLLRDLNKAVFDLRVEVRDKTVTNQENERRIRELEGWRWLPFVGGTFLINRGQP